MRLASESPFYFWDARFNQLDILLRSIQKGVTLLLLILTVKQPIPALSSTASMLRNSRSYLEIDRSRQSSLALRRALGPGSSKLRTRFGTSNIRTRFLDLISLGWVRRCPGLNKLSGDRLRRTVVLN